MTPMEAVRLYSEASTIPEVTALLRARGLSTEARFIESVEPLIRRDPARGLQLLRTLSSDESLIAAERQAEYAALAGENPVRAGMKLTEQRHHHRRSEALRWAATALTRGLASGKLGIGAPIEKIDGHT